MKKEKMLHYNPNTGKLEKCGAKMGRCPFGSENHFPESKLKEAQAYADDMNKKLAEEEKKRKIANPCPFSVKNRLNTLREEAEHYSSREEVIKESEKDNKEENQTEEDIYLEKMFKKMVGNENSGYHLEVGPTAKGIGFKKVKNHSWHYSEMEIPKHYLSQEEAMRDVERHNQNQAESKENGKDYTEKKIPKHYSSREEAMKDFERHNQDQAEPKENSEDYTPTKKKTEPFYSDEDRKREVSKKYENIKDPVDKKVIQIRDLKALIDNTGEEVSKINWNNIRVEDNKIICGEDWKLYDLTADNEIQGINSGVNSIPESIRRKLAPIAKEYFKEKKYILNNN